MASCRFKRSKFFGNVYSADNLFCFLLVPVPEDPWLTGNGKSLTASGSFLVEDLQLEAMNTVADHSLLRTMATTTGGTMVAARELEQIGKLLRERDDMKTLVFSETSYSDMLNLPLIFIIIVLLLAVEWITRKYHGEV